MTRSERLELAIIQVAERIGTRWLSSVEHMRFWLENPEHMLPLRSIRAAFRETAR